MYNSDENLIVVFNIHQTAMYMKHGAECLKVFRTEDDTLGFVFRKSDTRELYAKWLLHELA